MAETIGANRGITPTMREGIKGQSIRYNTDDKFVRDNSTIKDSAKKYESINRGRILDLEYYLGKDWIDWEIVKRSITKTSRIRIDMHSKVYRCSKCDEAYETNTPSSGKKSIGNAMLRSSIFKNLPMEKGECGICG